GRDPVGQDFAELNAPLIEGIDVPDDALHKHAVFVESNDLAERCRGQPIAEQCIRWAVAFEDAMGCKFFNLALVDFRSLSSSLIVNSVARFTKLLSKCQGFGLRKDVGHEQVVMAAERVQRLAEPNKIAGHFPRSLMDKLIERMLAVGARLAPIN